MVKQSKNWAQELEERNKQKLREQSAARRAQKNNPRKEQEIPLIYSRELTESLKERPLNTVVQKPLPIDEDRLQFLKEMMPKTVVQKFPQAKEKASPKVQVTKQRSYFSQPTLWTASDMLETRINQAAGNLKRQVPQYGQVTGNLQTSQEKLKQAFAAWQQNPTTENRAAYEQAKKQNGRASLEYKKMVQEYKPLIEEYAQSNRNYARYAAQQTELDREWKNSIRSDEEQIKKDLKAVNQEIDLLERQKTATEGDLLQVKNYGAAVGIGEGFQQKLDEIEAKLEGLYEQRRLLKEEQTYSSLYSYLALREEEDFEALSKVDTNNSDPAYQYINDINGAREKDWGAYDDSLFLTSPEQYARLTREESRPYDFLNTEEKALFNYLWERKGRKEAMAYVDFLMNDLNYRQGKEIARAYERDKLGQVADAAALGVQDWAWNMVQNLKNEDIPLSPQRYAFEIGREEASPLGKFILDSAHTVGNMAPSIFLSLATSNVSGAMGASVSAAQKAGQIVGNISMGLSAAGSAYGQALRDGYERGQARVYSMLVGASESLLQSALGGISRLGGISGKLSSRIGSINNAFLRVATKTGISMLGEGIEEGLQEILDPIFAVIALDEEYSPAELEDVAYSFLLGALMGGVFEGGEIAGNEINLRQSGKSLQAMGPEVVQKLIDTGLGSEQGSTAYQVAQKLQALTETGQEINPYQLGLLYKESIEGGAYGKNGKAARRAILSENQGQGAELDFETYYWMGRNGKTFEEAQEVANNSLPEPKRQQAFWAGQNDRQAASLPSEAENDTITAEGGMNNGIQTTNIPNSQEGDQPLADAGSDRAYPRLGNDSTNGIPGREPIFGERNQAERLVGDSVIPERMGVGERGLRGNSEWSIVQSSGISRLSQEQQERIKETAIRDEAGEPLEVTHWTENMEFDTFDEGDVGFHFGSEEQAQKRAKDKGAKEEGRYIRAYLDIHNPARVSKDQPGWNAAQASFQLGQDGIISFDDYLRIRDMAFDDGGRYNSESAKELRQLLTDQGYDGIVYQNEYEGAGESYIAFRPDQVMIVDDGKGNQQAAGQEPAISSAQAKVKQGGVAKNEWRYKTNARVVRTVEALAKYLGAEVEFTAPKSIRTQSGQIADGEYDSASGRIRIDSRAQDPILEVLKHEITHRMRSLAPAEYRAYAKFVLTAALDGEYAPQATAKINRILEVYRETGDFTVDKAVEEFVADFSVNLLQKDRVIRKLCRENMSRGQKILEWIKDIRAALRSAKESVKPEFRRDYGLAEEQLKKAEQLYIEGLRAANREAERRLAQQKPAQGKAGGKKHKIRDSFASEIDTWFQETTHEERLNDGGWFTVGTVSEPLKGIGVRDGKVYWRKSKIAQIMEDHPEMDEATIKRVPEILENPVIVMKSQTREDSIALFGELTAPDGQRVIAALDLSPRMTGGLEAEFSLLTSAYGKKESGAKRLVETSELLYLGPKKDRTDTWLMSLGVQFPSGQPAYGSIGTISYANGKVNIQGPVLSEYFGFGNESSARAALPSRNRRGAAEKDPLSIESYTEESYARYGWAAVNGLLNESELANFLQKIGQIAGGEKGIRTRRGQYIIPVGEKFGVNNKLIFSNGDYQNPSIEKVIVINLYSETEIDDVRRIIYESETKPGAPSSRVVEDYMEQWLLERYDREDWPDYWQAGRAQGAGLQRDAGAFGELPDGRRSAGEDQEAGELAPRYSLPEIRRREQERTQNKQKVKLTKREYAIIASEVNKNRASEGEHPRKIWFAYTDKKFVVYRTDDFGEFQVFASINIDGNEEKIDKLRKDIKRGYIQNSGDVDRWVRRFRRAAGSRSGDSAYAEGGRSADGAYGTNGRPSSLDSGADSGSSGRNHRGSNGSGAGDGIGDSPLSIESYTEESYARYGWAAVNGLLNKKELANFLKKIGQIAGGEKGIRIRRGQYIIPVGENFGVNNKLIFSNGDYRNPSIEKVVVINLEYETLLEEIRGDIYDIETGRSTLSLQAYQEIAGEELLRVYEREDLGDYRQIQKQKGAGLQRDAGALGELPDGGRSAGEAQEAGELAPRYSLPSRNRRGAAEKDPLSIESYTEESYDRYGWAAVNGLLNESELANFLQKIGQIAGGEKGIRTRRGQYIIPVGENFGVNNKLIFSNGDYQKPSIEKVIEIDLYTETEIDRIRRVIYVRESKPGTLSDQSLGDAFREELFCSHLREYYPTYAELIGESQRGLRQVGTGASGALRDGRRSAGEDSGDGELDPRYSLPEIRRREREAMRLREEVDYLKGELKQNRAKDADPKQMKALAGQLLLEYGSSYERAELSQALLELYRLVRQGQDPQARAEEIAGKILENTESWQEEGWQAWRELQAFLAEQGDKPAWESRAALAEFWPEWFQEDADSRQIEATLEQLESIYAGSAAMQLQKGWVAADICQRAFAIPPRETFADKEARKLAEARLAERMHEGRAAAEAKRLLALEREKRKAQVAALEEEQRSGKKAQSRKQKEKELRAKIQRAARRLSPKLLRPNNEKHIPEELRQIVAQLLAAINLESSYSISPLTGRKLPYDGGTPTKKTASFRALRQAYLKIIREEGDLPLSLDPLLLENLDSLGAMEEKPISQLGLEELEKMWQCVKAVEASIETANKALGAARFASIQQAAEGLLAENQQKEQKKEHAKGFARVDRLLNMDMLTPEAFFHRLGQAGDDLFHMLSMGQDQQIRILQQAAQDSQRILEAVDVRQLEEEAHSFVLESGKSLRMSTAQIMSLAMLLERPQARQHILEGGIRPKSFRGRNGALTQPTNALRLSEADCTAILSVLNKEQLDLAKRLQSYLCRELAEVGNRASMEVYGYEKFTDPDYFPIEVDKNQLGRDTAPQGQGQSIAGWSSAQQTVEGAKNPLMLDSIFAVYAQHISGMASYGAWLAPLENLRRIRDYRFRDEKGQISGSVKGLIQFTLGKDGLAYLDQLMEDLNRATQLRNSGFTDQLISNVKAAAVAANVRVAIQQPTAVLRALTEIDGKYLRAGMLRKGDWERVMQYAPIARWKDWGHFDINTGRQLRDVLLGTDSGLEKAKQTGMWLAGKADSLSWTAIWNAVELETRAERQDLPPGTEEFYQAVGDRFTQIINKTQVVDGLLQRSQIMRSQDALTRLSTSFMGEPTKSYNMFLNAVYDWRKAQGPESRKAAGKKLARTLLALNLALISNAIVQSLVDALRDDEKEKKYWEKCWEAFIGKSFWSGNLQAAWNPLNYLPYARDVFSIAQGYEASRIDLDSIEKVLRAAVNFYKALRGEGKQALGNAALSLLAESARLLGLPLANLRRDIQAVLITWGIETENYLYQYRLDRFLYNPQENKARFLDILYAAYEKDPEAYALIRDALLQEGFSEEELKKAIVQRQKEEEDYLEKMESLESGMLESLEGKSAWRALPTERKEAAEKAVQEYAKALAYWQTYKKEPLEGWKAKAHSARRDLGLSPEQYILLRQRYGRVDKKGSWIATVDAAGRYEKMCIAKELIGISPGTYLEFCAGLSGYDADENGSYSHAELEEAVKDVPGLSKAQRAKLWQLQSGSESTKNNPFSRTAARDFLKKIEKE